MSSQTVAAARRFVELLQENGAPSEERLARSLDELALAYHDTPEGDPSKDDLEPPSRGQDRYTERYAALGSKFTDFGYYSVADWSEALSKESLVGDAIDDLVDIERDLEEVIWRAENLGLEDAHWH